MIIVVQVRRGGGGGGGGEGGAGVDIKSNLTWQVGKKYFGHRLLVGYPFASL